jgi:hypothetical protein
MAPLDIDTALEWRGRTVVDRDGDKIGRLEELYLDESDRPAWGAVTTGLFGRRQSFVPLADLRPAGDDLQVPYEKDRVKDAPNVDPDEQLSGEEEDALHRHYGIADEAPPPPGPDADAEREVAAGGEAGAEARRERDAGDDVSEAPRRGDGDEVSEARRRVEGDDGDDGDDGGAEMIRSEEEVDVSTRRRVSGRARLRKYVVTENVKKVVPVQREEVRVEFEPAGEDAAEADARGEDMARDDVAGEDVPREQAVREDAAGEERARRH